MTVWTKEAIILESKKYDSRTEFGRGNFEAFQAANERGMLRTLYRNTKWSTAESIWDEAANYWDRASFRVNAPGAYAAAKRTGLLDHIYPPKPREDWSNDVVVLIEAHKYQSRAEFARNAQGAYRAALRRGLLPLVDFPVNLTAAQQKRLKALAVIEMMKRNNCFK